MSVRDAVVLPPNALIARVGDDPGDLVGEYHNIGARHREILESYLPADWQWTDKTYLDWGAGAGRLVSHFRPEATRTRIVAADIHEPSVRWIEEHLAPIEGLLVHEEPGIDLDDNSVDVVTGFSVMTHVTDHWAGWLLEIRRVLKPDGVALLSFCGEAMISVLLDRSVAIDDIGMLVLKYGNPWQAGGPTVMHSPWWIRAHWGRAFEVRRIDGAALQGVKTGHDLVLLQKPTSPAPAAQELEVPEPGEPRELRAVQTALSVSRAELCQQRADAQVARDKTHQQILVADDLALKLTIIRMSRSWRLTKPIRAIKNRIRPTDGWTLD